MRKLFLRIGSLFALVSVALGAFGSHGLAEILTLDQLRIFEIGVRYQFFHAIAIFALGSLLYYRKTKLMVFAGWIFTAGIILFSGSLYVLSVQELLNAPKEVVGPITPIGGTLLISGWALLFISTFQENEKLYKKKRTE